MRSILISGLLIAFAMTGCKSKSTTPDVSDKPTVTVGEVPLAQPGDQSHPIGGRDRAPMDLSN
ncbi:MAG: hypothetical protein K8T89_04010 [Planctomycetes bacterium]|nr:hypothetical protein [Planctomycetota bacterium]